MFKKFTLPQKLIASNFLYVIPVVILMIQMISVRSKDIHLAETERNGVRYLKPLTSLLGEVAQHQILAQRALGGDDVSHRLLPKIEQQVEASLSALTALHEKLAPEAGFIQDSKLDPALFSTQWNSLVSNLMNMTQEKSARAHDLLIQKLRGMISFTGDNSRLVLDPDLDSYYLISVMLDSLPQLLDRIQGTAVYAASVLPHYPFTAKERAQFSVFSELLQEVDLKRLSASIETALLEDKNFYEMNESMQRTMPKAAGELSAGVDAFATLLRKIAQGTGGTTVSSFNAAADRAMSSASFAWDVTATELETLLNKRIATISMLRARDILIGLAAILFAGLAAFFISRSLGASFRETSERLKALIENAPIGIATVDSRGRFQLFNPTFLTMLGYEGSELSTMNILDCTDPEDRAREKRYFDELIQGKRSSYQMEKRFLHKNGQTVWGDLAAAVVRDQKGNAIAFIGMINDITENKHLEQERSRLLREAKEAISMRDDFITMAAHELRTPITPIMIQFRILKKLFDEGKLETYPKEHFQTLFSISESQLGQLNDLVENMLNFSNVTGGQVKMQRQEFELLDLVSKLIKYFDWSLKKAQCPIKIEADGACMGYWDQKLLERVLGNLLENAIKFGEGKPILIRLIDRPEHAELSIHDEGIGISAEDQKRVFDRFERAVSLQEFGGFGLGLYIVKQIVVAHGGTIDVKSAPGKGSTFTIVLPKGQSAEAAIAS